MNIRTIFLLLGSLFFFISLIYLYITFSNGFINSFDGNNSEKYNNYVSLNQDYYLFKSENSICIKKENSYIKITNRIDSLSWSDLVIICYTRKRYFKINIINGDTTSYNSRIELFNSLKVVPSKNYSELPNLQR